MRIAQLCPPWLAVPPKGYGGIEWVVSLLADGLAAAGHDVTLFATGDSGTTANLEYVLECGAGLGPDQRHHAGRDAHDVLPPRRGRALRRPARPLAVQFARRRRRDDPCRPSTRLHGSFTPEMSRLYAQVADRAWFVAISEAQRRTNEALRYAGVVYNGIDVDRYPFVTEKDDYLLFLGRAAPEKGWLRAVETAVLTGRRLISAVKISHPTEIEEWEERIRPILPEGSEVLGEIGHEEKASLLAHAQAVLFPIDWDEPFGLVMTEAMACGTPVIATPRGSVPEVIADGETGWIVDVASYPEEAAERLAKLDSIDPAACRDRVWRLFSKEAMVAGYERIFAEVVSLER